MMTSRSEGGLLHSAWHLIGEVKPRESVAKQNLVFFLRINKPSPRSEPGTLILSLFEQCSKC